MKTTIVSLRRWLSVILALVFSVIGQAHAEESFTAQLALYQGMDLVTGMMEFDPTVITLIFNPSDKVDRVLRPDLQEAVLNFSAAINLYFDYDPATARPLLFQPVQVQSVVVLEQTAIETVTAELLATLNFPPMPSGVHLGPQDTAVAQLADQTYIALGHVTQQPDWTIRFDYRTITTGVAPTPIPTEPPAIPEPSTLVLFGIGCVGLFGFMRRQHKHKKVTGGNVMNVGKICILATVVIPLLVSSALASELTVTKQGTGDGRVVGVGIDCGADCTETYPDESMLQLKALPAADSKFKGWLIDGAPQKGTLVIRKDITVTAIFEKTGQTSQDIQVIEDEQGITLLFPSGTQRRIEESKEGVFEYLSYEWSPHNDLLAVIKNRYNDETNRQEPAIVTLYRKDGQEIGPFQSMPGEITVADDGRFVIHNTNTELDISKFVVYSADGQEVMKMPPPDQERFGYTAGAWFAPFSGILVMMARRQTPSDKADLLIFDNQYQLIKQYQFEGWPLWAHPGVEFDEQHERINVCRWGWSATKFNDIEPIEKIIFDKTGAIIERRNGCQ